MNAAAKSGPTEVIWEAVVIRADGSREDLGEIAHYYRNPFRRLLWKLRNR